MSDDNFKKIEPKTYERQSTCQVHGEYTERGGQLMAGTSVMWFGCPACGKAARDAEEAAEARKAEEARQARIEARLRNAGIPMAFRDRSFDNFRAETDEMRYAVDVARDFAENFWTRHHRAGTFLVLAGQPGTGKSHLALACAPAVMQRGTAMYLRTADLIRRVRSTWRRDSDQTEDEVLALLGRGLDLLIIDEVGVQRGTEDEQNIIFDVLDRRYSELRPTILLTNLGGKAFEEFLGPRVMDRLRERAIFVPFKWKSYRGRNGADS